MPPVDPPDRSSDGLEEILDRFEAAWRPDAPAPLEDYIPTGSVGRLRILVELVHADLEFRLKAGLPSRVEDYLGKFPPLGEDRAAVLSLLLAEYEFRRRREPGLSAEEYLTRFPAYGEDLRAALRLALAPPWLRDTVTTSPVGTLTPGTQGQPHGSSWPCIPGYEILGELGRGAMGVVYKARQAGLNRLVALKMILHADYVGEEERRRFRAEAEAIARLSHPNIVQVHEVSEHEGLPFFSLEYCEGGSLDARLGGKPLPPGEAAALIRSLAEAVQAAHEAKVVHRDLKPANVLLTFSREPPASATANRGRFRFREHVGRMADALAGGSRLNNAAPKVTDFGLAKRLDASNQTASRAVLGTPCYMAPEQAQGNAREVGPAADVYALGAILYECLTGRPPFVGLEVMDVLLQVVNDEPVALRALAPKAPRDLETICHQCLRKEPAKRYPSARDLAEDLRRWQAGEPITARPIGPLGRAVKWARRRPAVAGLLAALVAGVALAFWAVRREQVRTAAALAEARANLDEARLAIDECFGLAKDDPRLQGEHLRQVRKLLLEKTLPFYQRFTQRGLLDPALAEQQAEYLMRSGYITAEIADQRAALRTYQQAADLLTELSADNPLAEYTLAHLTYYMGDLQRQTGQLKEARASIERARDLFVRLCQQHPDDWRYRFGLGHAYHNLGLLCSTTGNRQEAIEAYRHALEIRVRLSEEQPEVANHQADLAHSWTGLGVQQGQGGDLRTAIQSYKKAKDTWLRLRKAHPRVSSFQSALASVYGNLAHAQQEAQQAEEALANYHRSLELLQPLAQAYPDVTEYQSGLANAWNNLGRLHFTTGRRQEALTNWTKAREGYENLTDAHPEVTAFRTGLGGTCCNLGVLLRDGGQPDKSLERFDEAIRHLEEVRRRAPDDATARTFLVNSRNSRAQALGRLRRPRESAAELALAAEVDPGPQRPMLRRDQAFALARAGDYLQAVQIAEHPDARDRLTAISLYNLARVYSLSAQSAAADATRPLPEREKYAERWAGQAVALLLRSHQAGDFRSSVRIRAARESRDLEFLRGREDFRQWLASLGQ